MNTRLISAVLHHKQSKLVALVERNGVRRQVDVTWQAKDQSDVPPTNWFAMVVTELDVRDADAFAAQRGMLPGY